MGKNVTMEVGRHQRYFRTQLLFGEEKIVNGIFCVVFDVNQIYVTIIIIY